MAPLVFVCPLIFASGVYADLHGGNAITTPFEMMHATLDDHGDMKHQVTLMFDFETPLVPAGRITIEAPGGRFTGGAEADRDAVVAFVEAVRNEYQLFPADFNLVALSENRALFNLMRESMILYCNKYGGMQECLTECRIRMATLCSEVSSWLGLRHPSVTMNERAVVSGFHASIKLQAGTISDDVRHAHNLVQLLNHRGPVPEWQAWLDATYPMPMDISWDRSYDALRTIYEEALKRIPGEVSLMKVIDTEDGQHQATVDISCEPHVICGAPAATRAAAKSKLMYALIKYVNTELGHPVVDLHFEVRQYQDSFINRYDRRTVGVFRCAEKLKELMDSTATVYEDSSAELSAKLSANPCTNVLFDDLRVFSVRLVETRARFNALYAEMTASRADRSELEARLAAVP